MALTQISTQGIKDGTITGTDLATNIDLVDNQKLRLGNSQDLQIYHDGSHSRIVNNTGFLALQSDSFTVNNYANSEGMIRAFADGASELYFNGSKKFETTSIGTAVTGSVLVSGGTNQSPIQSTTSNDYVGKFESSDSHARLIVQDSNSTDNHNGLQVEGDNTKLICANETGVKCVGNGAVELYHDNAKMFETTSTGVKISNGNRVLNIRQGINSNYVNLAAESTAGSNAYLDINSYALQIKTDGTTRLHIQNDGNIDIPDSTKLRFGSGDDLQIFHDGSNSKIVESGTGSLIIQTSNFNLDNAGGTENILTATENGAVELYYDNTKMFETTSDGATLQKGLTVRGVEGGDAQIRIEADEADNATDRFRLVATDSAGFHIQSYDGSQYDTLFKGVMNGGVELYHNNVKQMEITSLGASIRNHHKFMTGTVTQRVFQGGSAICTRLNVAGAGGNNTQGTFIRASANCSNIDDDDTVKFVVFGTGDVQNANNSYAGFSDVNLKQDIVDAGSQWNDIKNLKVRKYRFKNNPTGALQIGCIAQEVETVSSGLIETDPIEGFKSLKYSVLYMKAIKCLQEAMAKIEVLETEVAALKAS